VGQFGNSIAVAALYERHLQRSQTAATTKLTHQARGDHIEMDVSQGPSGCEIFHGDGGGIDLIGAVGCLRITLWTSSAPILRNWLGDACKLSAFPKATGSNPFSFITTSK
jgi:hypothetical protein